MTQSTYYYLILYYALICLLPAITVILFVYDVLLSIRM